MSADLAGLLATELRALIGPLRRGVDAPLELQELVARLGAPPGTVDDRAIEAIRAIVALVDDIEAAAARPAPSLDDIRDLLAKSTQALEAMRALGDAGAPFASVPGLAGDLAALLVAEWLESAHPLLHGFGALLDLVEPEVFQPLSEPVTAGTEVVRYPFRAQQLHLDRLTRLLRDPVGTLRAAYGGLPVTAAEGRRMANLLFPRVVALLRRWGLSARYGVSAGDLSRLGDSAPFMSHALVAWLVDPLHDSDREAGVVVSIASAEDDDLGFVFRPFGTVTTTRMFGPFVVSIELAAGVDVVAIGRHGLTLLADAAVSDARAKVVATLGDSTGGPRFTIGSPTGSRLELAGAQVEAEAVLSDVGNRVAVSAAVDSAALVVPPGDGDGFLSDVLSPDGLRAAFGLGLGWSSDGGLTFRGAGSLEATVSPGLATGPVALSAVHLSLRLDEDGGIGLTVSTSARAAIGPVHAAIERFGLAASLRFPAGGGNLGAAELDLALVPPTGVGIALDAHGVLTGGGFLAYDAGRGQYAGALQVSLHERLTLTALALLATRLPDGRPGYSLLVFVTAEGFQPIALGFGFVLQRVGGMVGINRTFDEAALRAGLKTDALRTLLFPRDPVANAPTILQEMERAFPTRRGSYLLGLLARITWFSPPLVQLDLALVLELGARERLLALGRVSALLPSAEDDLVRLQMDVLGVLDFDEGTFAADAVLVDSRLAHRFPITGAAALRARWQSGSDGADATGGGGFVLAVGGFHPRFAPPAGFPSLDRVTLVLASGKNPRLLCEAYLAVTPNTVQFGARASLYAEALGFAIVGDIGFDALIQLVPPHFLVDFHASVQLKRGSHNLFKVTIAGTLEGPLPLRIAAKARFEILFFDFTVHFDYTLAAGSAGPARPAVVVSDALTAALADPGNWRTTGTAERMHGVALRTLAPGAGIVVDPLGQLTVTQQVAPLNLQRDLDSYAGAPIAGARRFALTGAPTGLPATPVKGAFAPARYFRLRDDAALAAPSFEAMDAGLSFGDGAATHGPAVAAPLQYRTRTLGPLPSAGAAATEDVETSSTYTMPAAALEQQRASGAAARAPVRRVGRARFRNPAAGPAVRLMSPRWRVVAAAEDARAPEIAYATWSEADAAVETRNRAGGEWHVVPAHEPQP